MADKKTSQGHPLETLKTEIQRLSKTHPEQAYSIDKLAELAHHEATRKEKSPGLFKHSLEGLLLSVKGFEVSHPTLIEAVNDLCDMLAHIGI